MIGTYVELRDQALRVEEALRQVLERQEAWHCNRVWEAWAVDTMGRDDFSLVTEDPVAIEELVQAAMSAFRAVQGEPNDDRTPEFEAIEQELFKHQPLLSMQDGSIRGCKCMDRVFVTKTEDWGTHLAEVFTRLSRATVPDAATAAIERVTAERDAAMARIAKAWELHEPFTWSFGYGPVQSCKWCADHGVSQEVASWPCPTIAALEGAPEPEWEYGFHFLGDDGIVYKTRGGWDTPEKAQALGDEWIVDERESHLLNDQPDIRVVLIRRSKAGPWLPVEGESE